MNDILNMGRYFIDILLLIENYNGNVLFRYYILHAASTVVYHTILRVSERNISISDSFKHDILTI